MRKFLKKLNDVFLLFLLKKLFKITFLKRFFYWFFFVIINRRRPAYVNLELTNACNANCIMCPREEMSRPIKTMDFGLFKKLVDEVKILNPHTVVPFFYGESTLVRNFDEYISYLKKNTKCKISMNTNGSRLNEKNIDKILNCGLDELTISIDGYTRETFNTIRERLDLDIVRKGVLDLLAKRKEVGSKLKIGVFFVVMEQNKHEVEDFVNYWQPKVDFVSTTNFNVYHNKIPDFRTSEQKQQTAAVAKDKYPCALLWSNITIDSLGNAVPCCIDFNSDVKLGNTKNKTMKEVFSSKEYKEIRKKHMEGKIDEVPVCKDCNYYEVPNIHYLIYSRIPFLRNMF